MNYYFSKTVGSDFDMAIEKVTAALKEHGFGILTDIDVQATFKKKLDVDMYKYRILGACHPESAYQAILHEDKIGTMLPCNVIVQQKTDGGAVEVSAVDPMASMVAVKNDKLGEVATNIHHILKQTIENL